MAKRRFLFSRSFLLLCGAVIGILAFSYLWGTQTVLAFTLRHQAKKAVILDEKPLPIPSLAANSAPGMRLVPAGFSFEVPWDDLDVPNCKFGGNIAVFKFRSGRTLSFFGPSENHEDPLSTVGRSFGEGKGNKKSLFGPDTTRTNYSFQRALLEATPRDVTPFSPRQAAVRSSMLLIMKRVSAVGGETGLFELQANRWKGFQFDDPSKSPRKVTLEVYDNQDRKVEIVFCPGMPGQAGVSQADINRVLQSLHSTDEPQTIPQENGTREKHADARSSSAGD